MASTFRLKRKLYSDDKDGMSTGKKLALGGLAAGAAILGAKKGAFGANIMAKTNTGLMKAGKAVGGKVGDRMMMSGAKDFGVARAKQIDNALLKKTGSQMTKQAFNAKADQKGMQGKIMATYKLKRKSFAFNLAGQAFKSAGQAFKSGNTMQGIGQAAKGLGRGAIGIGKGLGVAAAGTAALGAGTFLAEENKVNS